MLLFTILSAASARHIILPAIMNTDIVETPSSQFIGTSNDIEAAQLNHRRNKRESYVPNDYYSNYYNDYYNNYYSNTGSSPSAYQPNYYYRPASADRFDGNSNYLGNNISPKPIPVNNYNFDRDDNNSINNNNIITSNGQKYVYTPIFQYKATHQKREKLFVPNLFG